MMHEFCVTWSILLSFWFLIAEGLSLKGCYKEFDFTTKFAGVNVHILEPFRSFLRWFKNNFCISSLLSTIHKEIRLIQEICHLLMEVNATFHLSSNITWQGQLREQLMPATACRVLILVVTQNLQYVHFSGSPFFYTNINTEISIKDQTSLEILVFATSLLAFAVQAKLLCSRRKKSM